MKILSCRGYADTLWLDMSLTPDEFMIFVKGDEMTMRVGDETYDCKVVNQRLCAESCCHHRVEIEVRKPSRKKEIRGIIINE
jgi:hypothetical protein